VTLPPLAAERDEAERRWLRERPTAEAAVAEADALLDRWTSMAAGPVGRDLRPPWVRHYWRVRNRRAGLGTRAGSEDDA
jgi:hypothetical protein